MITVNCIGLGRWGPNLVKVFATHPEARVGVACDHSEDRLALVRRNIPSVAELSVDAPATATDARADAIVIATPVATHHELALAALRAGKHVLVEKPMCRTLAEGEELIETARSKGVVLAIGHVFLFNPAVRAVAGLIASGRLGRLNYMHASRMNLGPIRTDVNVLWDLASHDLSILDFWLGEEPVSVTAHGSAYVNPPVEDVASASFVYPGGVVGTLHASWLDPRKVREITLVGERQMVVIDDMSLTEPVRVYDKGVALDRKPGWSDSFGAFRMEVRQGDIVIPHVAGPEPLAAEAAHFVDCVLGRAEPINDGRNGLRVLRALEAADRSMRAGSALVSC